MDPLAQAVDGLAARGRFSGVVRVDRGGRVELERAYGLADRAHSIPMTPATQLGVASGTKGFTALAVVSLIEGGALDLSTTARAVLGDDLPLIADAVTIEQLLAHRSGIGDYYDEEAGFDVGDYVLRVGAHELATTEQYLAVLDGYPAKFAPGARFAYSNSGYVVLALIAERVAGTPFHELVRARVCDPAGMPDTAFLRSDELPGSAALGYLDADGLRTNVFHLPVLGSGDGGIYSTASDIARFWEAVFAGRIVSPAWVAELVRPRSKDAESGRRYGLGVWLAPSGDGVMLEGLDAGVSFRSRHDPAAATTCTVISNTADGAWPLARLLDRRLGERGGATPAA
jgi:CubicO group peptidase (beta-lactamase class C family)